MELEDPICTSQARTHETYSLVSGRHEAYTKEKWTE